MTSGATMKDFLPIPDSLQAVTDPDKTEQSHSLTEEATFSHALATADHDEKGRAQEVHDDEVKDLGWHESADKIPDPLVGRLDNEELWVLMRRFDKVITFVMWRMQTEVDFW